MSWLRRSPQCYYVLKREKGYMATFKLLAAFALLVAIITAAPTSSFARPPWPHFYKRVTIAEAEAHFMPPTAGCAERCPEELKRPFGYINGSWEALKGQMQPGDELWSWD